MYLLIEILLSALLVVGGLFALIGSYGLLRLPKMMMRLHAPTKAATVGVGSALIASMVYAWVFEARISWHELLITLFLFIAAPLSALFMAKVKIHLDYPKEDLPRPSGKAADWATLNPDLDQVTIAKAKPAPLRKLKR